MCVCVISQAIIGSLNSIHSHGAYRFPLMPVPDAHDLHHSKFHWNFGTGPLDKAHGTRYVTTPRIIDGSSASFSVNPRTLTVVHRPP